MIEKIFGKSYYIDLDSITANCRTGDTIKDDEGKDVLEINVFKYELFKLMIERVLGEVDEIDEEIGPFAQKSTSVSFKIAFNTLLKYGIIIEENEDENE
jgi:hypothetical protein